MPAKKSTSNLLIEQMKKKLAKQNSQKENDASEENEDSNEEEEAEDETQEAVEEPEVPKFDKKGKHDRRYFYFYKIFRDYD